MRRRFAMMGRQAGDQSQLFYLFNLERRVPAGHLLRRINPVVTRILVELREKLAPFYSDIGRPSIDPELMIRMLIVGYCYGKRVGLVVVSDKRHIMIFVDDLQRHEVLAGVGKCDRQRPGCEIEHAKRIKRVAVEPNDRLVLDRGRLAAVTEPSFHLHLLGPTRGPNCIRQS